MRKSIFRTLVFLITLSSGIAISFIWYFSNSSSNEKVENILVQSVSENKDIKFTDEKTKPWILKISPCDNKNSITFPSLDWKGNRTIAGGVINRWAICGNLPEYPKIAKDERISDVVTVDVIVDEIGEVKESHAKTGNRIFYESAVNAAYKTRFSPRMLGGVVYKVKGTLMYKFDFENGTWLQDPSAPDNPFRKSKK